MNIFALENGAAVPRFQALLDWCEVILNPSAHLLRTGVQPTPIRLTAILGDVIHNLRSSLDHLAFQLVWVGTGAQPSNIYFPIAVTKQSIRNED
jgi:hypothetical protein